jgi:hypothetical protein
MIRGEVDDAGYSAKFCHKNRMPSGYPAVKSRNVVHRALSCEELTSAPRPINMLRQECCYGPPYTATFCHRNLHADLPNKTQFC